jgi:hypothetical protein
MIAWSGQNLAVPLSRLIPFAAGGSSAEAMGDWHYWVAQSYCFLITLADPNIRRLAESTRRTSGAGSRGPTDS